MIKYDVEQNTPEWHEARLGIPTASGFKKIITPTGQESKQMDGYADELIAEMITGESSETFEGNRWTGRGKLLEPEAILFYEQAHSLTVERVGFVTDDARTMGCSPDFLVGEDGAGEIKVLSPKNHISTAISPNIDREHYPQVQGQLYVLNRKWVDIMSYHPKIKPVIIRIPRDEEYIFQMAKCMGKFNSILFEKKKILIEKGFMKEPV